MASFSAAFLLLLLHLLSSAISRPQDSGSQHPEGNVFTRKKPDDALQWIWIEASSLALKWPSKFALSINGAVTAYQLSLTQNHAQNHSQNHARNHPQNHPPKHSQNHAQTHPPNHAKNHPQNHPQNHAPKHAQDPAQTSTTLFHAKTLRHQFEGLKSNTSYSGRLIAMVGMHHWPYTLLNFTITSPALRIGLGLGERVSVPEVSSVGDLEDITVAVRLRWTQTPFTLGDGVGDSKDLLGYLLKAWDHSHLVAQVTTSTADRNMGCEATLNGLELDTAYKITLQPLTSSPENSGPTLSFSLHSGALHVAAGGLTTDGVRECYSGLQVRCPGAERCVSPYWICDGAPDCPDGADEVGCEKTPCAGFRCYDDACIAGAWRCDGYRDCKDGDDEYACPECGVDEVACPEGAGCIPHNATCDGINHCPDGWDESGSVCGGRCGAEELRCPDGGDMCVPHQRLCDGVPDCPAAGDEEPVFCAAFRSLPSLRNPAMEAPPPPCQSNESGEEETQNENQENHVKNQENQRGHQENRINCSDEEFRCMNGACINPAYLCNGIQDCVDGEDELPQHCPPTTTAATAIPKPSLDFDDNYSDSEGINKGYSDSEDINKDYSDSEDINKDYSDSEDINKGYSDSEDINKSYSDSEDINEDYVDYPHSNYEYHMCGDGECEDNYVDSSLERVTTNTGEEITPAMVTSASPAYIDTTSQARTSSNDVRIEDSLTPSSTTSTEKPRELVDDYVDERGEDPVINTLDEPDDILDGADVSVEIIVEDPSYVDSSGRLNLSSSEEDQGSVQNYTETLNTHGTTQGTVVQQSDIADAIAESTVTPDYADYFLFYEGESSEASDDVSSVKPSVTRVDESQLGMKEGEDSEEGDESWGEYITLSTNSFSVTATSPSTTRIPSSVNTLSSSNKSTEGSEIPIANSTTKSNINLIHVTGKTEVNLSTPSFNIVDSQLTLSTLDNNTVDEDGAGKFSPTEATITPTSPLAKKDGASVSSSSKPEADLHSSFTVSTVVLHSSPVTPPSDSEQGTSESSLGTPSPDGEYSSTSRAPVNTLPPAIYTEETPHQNPSVTATTDTQESTTLTSESPTHTSQSNTHTSESPTHTSQSTTHTSESITQTSQSNTQTSESTTQTSQLNTYTLESTPNNVNSSVSIPTPSGNPSSSQPEFTTQPVNWKEMAGQKNLTVLIAIHSELNESQIPQYIIHGMDGNTYQYEVVSIVKDDVREGVSKYADDVARRGDDGTHQYLQGSNVSSATKAPLSFAASLGIVVLCNVVKDIFKG